MHWRGEICKFCGRDQRLAWSLKKGIWDKVMGKRENRIACLECFLKRADEKKIQIQKTDFNFFGWVGENIKGDILIDS